MMGQPQPHLFVQGVHAAQDPKHIDGALDGHQSEVPKIISHHGVHREPHAPFKEGDYRNHHLSLSPHNMPVSLLSVPQAHIVGNLIIGDEFLHRLL